MKFGVKHFAPLYVGIFVFLLDFISKWLTHHYLPLMRRSQFWYPYGGVGILKDFYGIEFSLSHQINYGAAWGLLSDYQLPLLYVRIALIVMLFVYALWINKNSSWNIPLGLIISGALCNVLDYYLYGHVIDMFHFIFWGYDYPVFNVADSAIFIGIGWLLISSLFEKKTSPKRK